MPSGKLPKTEEQFLIDARKIHGNVFLLDKVRYVHSKQNILVGCRIHGYFKRTPNAFLRGQGCPKCRYIKMAQKLLRGLDGFLCELKEVWGDEIEMRADEHIRISRGVLALCKVCGYEWFAAPRRIIQRGCPACNRKVGAIKRSYTFDQIKDLAVKVHGTFYDYSNSCYMGYSNKMNILCRRCNREFMQTPHKHLMGRGCPFCLNSLGENKIRRYLENGDMNFVYQYKIPECKNKRPLPFDFAVFNNDGSLRCLIEYQGQQHFWSVPFFGGQKEFNNRLKNDVIKQDYCNKNNIQLLTVAYNQDLNEFFEEAGGLLHG